MFRRDSESFIFQRTVLNRNQASKRRFFFSFFLLIVWSYMYIGLERHLQKFWSILNINKYSDGWRQEEGEIISNSLCLLFIFQFQRLKLNSSRYFLNQFRTDPIELYTHH